MRRKKQSSYVVAVNMGYGHLRAAYNLEFLSTQDIFSIDTYRGIPKKDKRIWEKSRKFYEFVSRFKKVPVVGEAVFSWFNRFQAIEPYYPHRDLSKPSMQLKQTMNLIRKGWGRDFINKLNKNPLSLISTFFVTAFMAEEWGYKNDIYLLVCDADISRAWASDRGNDSRIKYLAPTERVASRLKMYGVPEKNIYFTGFPLPQENTGSSRLTTIKKDLGLRLPNLDPHKKYINRYEKTIKKYVGSYLKSKSDHPLTIMFAVGGAGAQRNIGIGIIKSMIDKIKTEKIKIILVAGIHNEINAYFKDEIYKLGLGKELKKKYIEIIHAPNKPKYFTLFNKALHKTDILWTKPSELSFYVGLGIPIITSEPLGSQEFYNRGWMEKIGASRRQNDVQYTSEWLYDWIDQGFLADAAMQGFIEAPNMGSFNIEKLVNKRKSS